MQVLEHLLYQLVQDYVFFNSIWHIMVSLAVHVFTLNQQTLKEPKEPHHCNTKPLWSLVLFHFTILVWIHSSKYIVFGWTDSNFEPPSIILFCLYITFEQSGKPWKQPDSAMYSPTNWGCLSQSRVPHIILTRSCDVLWNPGWNILVSIIYITHPNKFIQIDSNTHELADLPEHLLHRLIRDPR